MAKIACKHLHKINIPIFYKTMDFLFFFNLIECVCICKYGILLLHWQMIQSKFWPVKNWFSDEIYLNSYINTNSHSIYTTKPPSSQGGWPVCKSYKPGHDLEII